MAISPLTPNHKVTEQESEQIERWRDLTLFVNKWFHKPDFDALQMVISQYCSHWCLTDPPVWIFLLGAPSTGKSSLYLKSVEELYGSYKLGEITKSSFVSGYNKKYGILKNLKDNNGILVNSDFSSFLGMKYEDKDAIQSQLRQIYDGRFSRNTGMQKEQIEWKGKVTFIAACTMELENHWSLGGALGERFLQYRLQKHPEKISIMREFAIRQMGHTEEITLGIQNRASKMVEHLHSKHDTYYMPDLDRNEFDKSRLSELADVVSLLRTNISRDGYTRKITSVCDQEGFWRITQALAHLAKGSAILFKRNQLEEEDLQMARIVAAGSIPSKRFVIVESLAGLRSKRYEERMIDNEEYTNIPHQTYERVVEDLVALKVLHVKKTEHGRTIKLSNDVLFKFQESKLPFRPRNTGSVGMHLVTSSKIPENLKNSIDDINDGKGLDLDVS